MPASSPVSRSPRRRACPTPRPTGSDRLAGKTRSSGRTGGDIMSRIRRRAFAVGSAAFALTAPSIVGAQKKYDPGVTDKGITAFWQMVNDQGGINGRKINFITYDDGFQPPKTVEMVRKLVEDDQVF